MSLSQGKLEDAESALNLALRAARRLEPDDTGSLHVRLLLNVAMTHIERGRPRSAKRVLEPIARRREGHVVPPLIARFYLGIIDHLGGEYRSAEEQYGQVLQGFRSLRRTRAAAFVLRSQADLHLAMKPGDAVGAVATAREAIDVAQRGGHEDVRMLATLTLVRLHARGAREIPPDQLFRQLDEVDRYGQVMGMPRVQVQAHEVRASLLHSHGETTRAAREASASAEVAALYDLKLYKCKALLTLAQVLMLRHESKQAMQIVQVGLEMAQAAEYFSCVRGFRLIESAHVRPN
jgi:ATP/maltotriose-dependent transcriptional regulator MalT